MTTLNEFTMNHYQAAITLWQETPGIGLSDSDSPESMQQFLNRNQGNSFVSFENGRVTGTILCGHDGRRGYIYHLAVHHAYRRQGIATQLVDQALASLKKIGILKCHLFVFAQNESSIKFWQQNGWQQRDDLQIMSKYTAIANKHVPKTLQMSMGEGY